MYEIIMVSWGGTENPFLGDLTRKDAEQICEEYNWQMESMNGGYIWDLEIREMR